jgi:hypothetical protein
MARYTVETPTGKQRKTVYGKTREEAHEKLSRPFQPEQGAGLRG